MQWFDILILSSVLLRKGIMAVILIGLTICGVKGQKPSWGEAQAENLLVFYDKRFQLTVYGWQLFKAPPPLVTWWTAGENICPKSQLRFANPARCTAGFGTMLGRCGWLQMCISCIFEFVFVFVFVYFPKESAEAPQRNQVWGRSWDHVGELWVTSSALSVEGRVAHPLPGHLTIQWPY